ncbi:hypothetical protein CVT24_011348 [Panaeolus cyanescens]|uniref:Uncharacterized protein n=1 Tax=Panaeolus cyanescens TaxID=181874 RepID=A0A409YGI0_9AGAR|nr:hypothetical protein CVT24_011348 [Panaeolus cyanescens]
MVECTLKVYISDIQLESIPEDYSLCVARYINDVPNVIWAVIEREQITFQNTFKWKDEYQVFAADKFKDSTPVIIKSKSKTITFGQTATYSEQGVMSDPVHDEHVTGLRFRVHNEHANTNLGVSGKGTDGKWTPIFISHTRIIYRGDADFTPLNKAMVFLAPKDLVAGTMLSYIPGPRIEADLTNGQKASVTFTGEAGKGDFVPGPPPDSNSAETKPSPQPKQ